jgi:hypothetical protein
LNLSFANGPNSRLYVFCIHPEVFIIKDLLRISTLFIGGARGPRLLFTKVLAVLFSLR